MQPTCPEVQYFPFTLQIKLMTNYRKKISCSAKTTT